MPHIVVTALPRYGTGLVRGWHLSPVLLACIIGHPRPRETRSPAVEISPPSEWRGVFLGLELLRRPARGYSDRPDGELSHQNHHPSFPQLLEIPKGIPTLPIGSTTTKENKDYWVERRQRSSPASSTLMLYPVPSMRVPSPPPTPLPARGTIRLESAGVAPTPRRPLGAPRRARRSPPEPRSWLP